MSLRPALPFTAATVLTVALLAGCASGVKLDDTVAPVEQRPVVQTAPQAAAPSADASGTAQSQVSTVDLSARQAAAAQEVARVVYFDFDSYVVRPEFVPVIDANARRMAAQPQQRLTVAGHTDERGGREYNLALGQRRAEAVVRSLVLAGADQSRLEPISFGAERPAASGSDEQAWAQNRRAEIQTR